MPANRLYVHRLVGQQSRARVRALEDSLRLAAGAGAEDEFELFIFPQSGCYRFFRRRHDVEVRIGQGHIDSERAAQEVVARFIDAVNRNWRTLMRNSRVSQPEPFPEGLVQHAGSMLIRGRNARDAGQWFSRWATYFPTGSSNSLADGSGLARASGGDVVVRLSDSGAVIEVASNLRLWESSRLFDAYPRPQADSAIGNQGVVQGHAHGLGTSPSTAHGGSTPAEIIYLLEAPHIPQPYAAPFYNFTTDGHQDTPGGHGITMRPATPSSLLVGIAFVGQGPAPPRVVASMTAANGEAHQVVHGPDWYLSWSIVKLDDLFGGEGERVNATSVRLVEPGTYHVELSVRQIATGVEQRTWRQVMYSPTLVDTQRRSPALV